MDGAAASARDLPARPDLTGGRELFRAGVDDYRTIRICYEGRRFSCDVECEFYYTLYDQGLGHVVLACPSCMKGVNDVPVEAEGDPEGRCLVLRREKKHFTVDSEGRLSVDETVGCSYCGQWHVRIRNGVAVDVVGG